MVQRAEAATPARRKQMTEEAIRLAVAGDWKRAAEANGAILDLFPDDVEAANRLGKAYTELGQPKKAIQAYQRTLEIDAFNNIARRNLERLEQAGGAAKAARGKKPKTGADRGGTPALVSSAAAAEFRLQQANPAEIAKLEPGDAASLQPNARGVAVLSEDGVILGYIEPKAGLRLRRMVEGGNRYTVTIRSISDHGQAIVFIREIHRDPSLVGQASFLSAAEARRRAPRAYTRRSALIDEDEPDFGDDDEEPLAELDGVEVDDVDLDDDDDVDLSSELGEPAEADDDDDDDADTSEFEEEED